LRANVKILKSLCMGKYFMAVLKADAYGHGSVEVAKEVLKAGVDRIGVSLVEEGAHLRHSGIKAPIQVLSALSAEQAEDIIDCDLISSVSGIGFVRKLSSMAQERKKKAIVHLKIDTGLHRFGVLPDHAFQFCKETFRLPNLEWEGVFTHLSDADNGDWKLTSDQVYLFEETLRDLAGSGFIFPIKHVGGSSIAIERPDMHFDMVRPGISLFGYCPSTRQEKLVSLQQVMQIKTKITQIRSVEPLTKVGYGGGYRTEGWTRIGTLPIGFGDGYHKAFASHGVVLVQGNRCKIAGSISLDQTLIDLSPVPEAREGDEVVILGKQGDEIITGREMATWMDGVPDQVVACLTRRMRRVYTGGS
jgi:alanine racemase